AATENITLDQTVEVTVTLQRDGSQPVESYRPPTAPDFDPVHTSDNEQMQFSVVNGRQAVRMVEQHVYVFKPKKRGNFTIQAPAVKFGGHTPTTKSLTTHGGPPLKNALTPVQPLTNAPPIPGEMRGDEGLFVAATVDKPKVYVGQQVTATWRLFTQSEIL